MFVTKKHLSRRSVLRGVGTALALPLLDAMVPAFAGPTEVASKSPTRMGFVYIPQGAIIEKWTPATEGAGYQMTPILQPLEPLRDHVLVLTGLDQRSAEAAPSENNGPHTRTTAAYLTGVHPKQTRGADYLLAPSVDQIAAAQLGKQTQLSSLELALDTGYTSGVCEGEWSCVYANTLSWRTPTTPLPVENHPRVVFERLFGDNDTTDSAARVARMRENRSLLDFVSNSASRLMTGLGPTDRAKLTEYLDAIRDVERRIEIAEEQASREVPTLERPGGSIPGAFEDYIKLMFDMQVLAYQTDLTRVSTFMIAHESSNRTYPQIGVPDPHHPLTHHRGLADMKAKVAIINNYHVKMFGYFLDRLRSTPDGDGSLLDHSMVLYGSGISDGNFHTNENLPLLLAGGAGGKLKGGRHLKYPVGTPMTNLFLTMLDKVGVNVDKMGDSTGKLELLSVA